MNAIHGQRGNIVLSISGYEQRVVIDHLNALRRGKLRYPLVELIDALESLRAGICLFRQAPGPHGGWFQSPRRCDASSLSHHGLDVVRSVGKLPSGIDVVGAGQDMHRLGLQIDDIRVETRGDLARCQTNDAHVKPVVLREGSLLPRPVRDQLAVMESPMKTTVGGHERSLHTRGAQENQ
jgi:hypothetical protein